MNLLKGPSKIKILYTSGAVRQFYEATDLNFVDRSTSEPKSELSDAVMVRVQGIQQSYKGRTAPIEVIVPGISIQHIIVECDGAAEKIYERLMRVNCSDVFTLSSDQWCSAYVRISL